MLGNYKKLYEIEKIRADRLELELRQLNDTLRTESMRNLVDARNALKIASETIASLQRGIDDTSSK